MTSETKLPFSARDNPNLILKLDGLELHSSGLIGPKSESSSFSLIIFRGEECLIGELSIDSENSFFFRSPNFGVGICRGRSDRADGVSIFQ